MRRTKTYDNLLLMKDAGAMVTTGFCHVLGVDHTLDVGEGLVEGDIILDVSACEVNSDDEDYVIVVMVSSSATFANDVYAIQGITLGSAGTAMGDNILGDVDMGVGRWILPFNNMVVDGDTKRYVRLFVIIGGTIVTGINFTAYLAKKN